jgi:hypothetical protein
MGMGAFVRLGALVWVVVLFSPLRALAGEPLDTDFNDPSKCASCHREIFEQWSGSMHAGAAEDRIFRRFFEIVVKEVGPAAADFCMKCHSPVGVLRGQALPATGEKLDPIAMKGLFCDFCHTVTPLGIGNSAFDTTFAQVKKGPFEAGSPAHGTKTDGAYRDSAFCGMCHSVTHPVSGRPIERTYQEWKESPYNTGDPATTVNCQDCHMRQSPGNPATGATARPDLPGRAASGAPDRPHLWSHYFVGGNTLFDKAPKAEERSSLARERLKNAAKVEIIDESTRFEPGGMGAFRVRVQNVGAGHKLPTGLSEVREMWLDVKVADADGKVLLRSGEIGDNGAVDPGAAMFKTYLGIAGTNVKMSCCFFSITEAKKLLSAEQITRDRRILPKGYDEEKYAFRIPADASFPIKIEAALNYRSMSQAFADMFLYGEQSVSIPVTRMAEASLSVQPPKR